MPLILFILFLGASISVLFFFIPAYFDEGEGRKVKVEEKREETRNLLWPSLKSLADKSITFFLL